VRQHQRRPTYIFPFRFWSLFSSLPPSPEQLPQDPHIIRRYPSRNTLILIHLTRHGFQYPPLLLLCWGLGSCSITVFLGDSSEPLERSAFLGMSGPVRCLALLENVCDDPVRRISLSDLNWTLRSRSSNIGRPCTPYTASAHLPPPLSACSIEPDFRIRASYHERSRVHARLASSDCIGKQVGLERGLMLQVRFG